MLGINKRLDKIEYRLARIDKMLEDMMTVPKQKPSIVIHKPKLKQNNWYPDQMPRYLSGRYRTIEDICKMFDCKKHSAQTYLKNMREDKWVIIKRGRAPTSYKLAKGANHNG